MMRNSQSDRSKKVLGLIAGSASDQFINLRMTSYTLSGS